MKIGFVLDDGLDKPDGVQQYILTLGNWFIAHGHEVRYLVGETKRNDIDGVYSLAKNVKVRFNGNALTIPLPASKKAIKQALHNEKFDVLHVQVPYSPFMGAKVIMAAPKETVVVGTFHILPYGWISRVGTRLLGIWLHRSLKRFNAQASVSKPAALFAAQTFKTNSVVIPNSVHIDEFKPTEPIAHFAGAPRVLFLGRLVERKGCKQLLQSLAILHHNGQLPIGTKLDICGDGALRPELEAFAIKNNLEDSISFHGFVTQEEKVSFMQQADIAVFPSLSGESFGIVLIEAMAAGAGVVLGGNNPGYESVLADVPGSIIDAHQPSVMAKQLAEIINNSAQQQRLHAAQQAHVAQFDTAVVANTLLQLYQPAS